MADLSISSSGERLEVLTQLVIDMLDRFRSAGAIAHQAPWIRSGILQLVERPTGDRCHHARCHDRFAAVGKMHGAFAIDDIKGLVGVVTVHVVFVAGLGVNMQPGVKLVGVENDLAFAFFRPS